MSVNDPVLSGLHKRIRGHIDSIAEVLTSGNCSSFPEYTKQAGIMHGLELVERDLLDMDEKLHADE